MLKKVLAKLLVLAMILSVFSGNFGKIKVYGVNYFQAALEEGNLRWDVFEGANRYQIIILNEERKEVASYQKEAYYLEESNHQFCQYDVMGRLQEIGESNEGKYIAYVIAYSKSGENLGQSIDVNFSFIPHIHQWEKKYQYNTNYHWCNCGEVHCYVTSNQQKKGLCTR